MIRSNWFKALFVVLALTLASGAMQGRMRGRWGPASAMVTAGQLLETFPTEFGDWKLLRNGELGEDATNQLEPTGWLVRTYENRKTGTEVSAILLVGPPGPISVHTPEVCISSQQYKIIEPRRSVTLGDTGAGSPQHTFWAATFQSTDVVGSLLRTYWAWTTDGTWQAAKGARYRFAGEPYLYKVQVSASYPPGADFEHDDSCRDFLADFVKAAPAYLKPTSRN